MPEYDSVSFQPPASVAYVALRNGATGEVAQNVPMLLDTGADVTLVPRRVIDILQVVADSEKQYQLFGYDGNRSLVQVIRLDLVFCRRTFRGEFLPIDQEWGILGRNILNAVALIFDGPQLKWEERRSQ